MFEIIFSGDVLKVYKVKKILFKTYFLVFKDEKWEWMKSDKTLPYNK